LTVVHALTAVVAVSAAIVLTAAHATTVAATMTAARTGTSAASTMTAARGRTSAVAGERRPAIGSVVNPPGGPLRALDSPAIHTRPRTSDRPAEVFRRADTALTARPATRRPRSAPATASTASEILRLPLGPRETLRLCALPISIFPRRVRGSGSQPRASRLGISPRHISPLRTFRDRTARAVTVPADTAQKTMDRAGIRISINR